MAEPSLTACLLGRLSSHDPALTIEARLDDSRELLDAFDRGKIDAAIIRREDDRRDGEVLAPEHFGWFATPDFVHQAGEPLRLATFSPSCCIRNLATRSLDAAGIAWQEVFPGCGAFAVAEAVSVGLATSVFSCRLAPPGTIEVGRRFNLPAIPSSEILRLSTLSDAKSRAALRTLATAFREHRPQVIVTNPTSTERAAVRLPASASQEQRRAHNGRRRQRKTG